MTDKDPKVTADNKPLSPPAFDPTAKTTLQRPEVVIKQGANAATDGSSIHEATARMASTPPPFVDVGVLPVGPGSVIKDRFLLKEQIGSGGMGVVFSAIDQRKTEAMDPNPMVAIKILGPDFARHPQALMSLQRESRKAQELAHPNIITVFDFDRDGDIVFMTMELLQGRSLDSFIREVRGTGVAKDIAMPIIRGIAEGLAYAHRKGIVHSDLKPANIFLCKDNSPKLLDFGIARAVPESTRFAKDVFDAGTLGAYTLPYATEEMVAGVDPHPADDLYALGIMATELLSGQHPFKRLCAVDARKQGLKATPIQGLSRDEWQTIERCLSFDRTDRPKDASEFLRLLGGPAAQATGASRSRTGLYAAAAVLLAAVVTFAYSGFRSADTASSGGAKFAATSSSSSSNLAREIPNAGKIEHVGVTSHGQGPTLQAAVDQALQLAVEQINGKSIDSSSTQFQGGMAVAFGPDPVQLSSASFANYVTTKSRGVVTDFRIVDQQQVDNGYEATIRANIAKFVRPESANRLRVVVAPLRTNRDTFVIDTRGVSSQEVSDKIHKDILDALVQTNRVAALDREFSAELDSELDLIASGRTPSEDQARMSQQLVADYVLVGTLEKFEYKRHERHLRLSERTLVSNSGRASLSLRLINTATRQAEFAGTVLIDIPETEPSTLNPALDRVGAVDRDKQFDNIVDGMIRQLSEQSVSKVMSRLYPVTVLTVEGDDVVLSQGEGQVHEGKTYKVIWRGKEMKDPQTGQSLGRLEKDCCTIKVTKVTPSLSYGSLVAKTVDVAKVFAPGALELGEQLNATASTPGTETIQSADSPKAGNHAAQKAAVENKSASSKADSNW